MTPAGSFEYGGIQAGVEMLPATGQSFEHGVRRLNKLDNGEMSGDSGGEVQDLVQRNPLGDQQVMQHSQHQDAVEGPVCAIEK